LRLERAAHPRFFAVVDDVCARLSMTTPQALFLINESNAFNARVESRSTIMLGFASLVASDVTALRSTLGHELGHHLADDTADPALLAWAQLEAMGQTRWLAFPFAPLAGRLATRTKADTMRRCRINEHAADFWGGVAAGHDTTAGCLLQDRRASLLWSGGVDDVVVLREAGLRVDDLYRCLRYTSHIADEDGFAMLPATRGTGQGFGVGPRWQNPFASAPSPTTPAWEHDTEEIMLPVRADNSDRERRSDLASCDEAPAAE